MRILSLLVVATLVRHLDAGAQVQPSRLRAVVDLRIDKTLPAASRSVAVAVGPVGEMIIVQTQSAGSVRGFDSTGRELPWTIPIGNNRDGDLRWISRAGWSGNTLWLADPGFSQLALIDRAGKITKSLEYPAWVRPAWADRRKYPVFAGIEPFALYPDGSWLVRPSRERSVVSTPEYDKTHSYLMRISENGSVQRVVARLPRDDIRMAFRFANTPISSPLVIPPLTMWDVSPDGARVVVVATSLSGADSASYRVTALGALGDTIYSRRIPFAPVPMTKATIDSIRTRFERAGTGRQANDARDAAMKNLPWAYPPIENVVAGRDQTTWIELRGTAAERTWLVLDSSGASLGIVAFSKEFVLRVAERGRAWGFDRDGDRVVALVRYRVGLAEKR